MAKLPDGMHSFAKDAQKDNKDPNKPPNVISGGSLDDNFRWCLPAELDGDNQPYKVTSESDGWRLEPTMVFDVCENGQPRRIRFFACR
jgi:hypothetical protein